MYVFVSWLLFGLVGVCLCVDVGVCLGFGFCVGFDISLCLCLSVVARSVKTNEQ